MQTRTRMSPYRGHLLDRGRAAGSVGFDGIHRQPPDSAHVHLLVAQEHGGHLAATVNCVLAQVGNEQIVVEKLAALLQCIADAIGAQRRLRRKDGSQVDGSVPRREHGAVALDDGMQRLYRQRAGRWLLVAFAQ